MVGMMKSKGMCIYVSDHIVASRTIRPHLCSFECPSLEQRCKDCKGSDATELETE